MNCLLVCIKVLSYCMVGHLLSCVGSWREAGLYPDNVCTAKSHGTCSGILHDAFGQDARWISGSSAHGAISWTENLGMQAK